MINMQDLINVRESYSKKMLEEAASEEHERKIDLIMMLSGGNPNMHNNYDHIEHQMRMF
jgi:hypothetical protein